MLARYLEQALFTGLGVDASGVGHHADPLRPDRRQDAFDEIDVGQLEMYTSEQFNSRILEEYIRKKLEKTYGPDKERYLEKMRTRQGSVEAESIPVASTIDPNAREPSQATAADSDPGQ